MTTRLPDAQAKLQQLVSAETLLVAHSGENDLQALRVRRPRPHAALLALAVLSGPSYRCAGPASLQRLGRQPPRPRRVGRHRGWGSPCYGRCCAAPRWLLLAAQSLSGQDSRLRHNMRLVAVFMCSSSTPTCWTRRCCSRTRGGCPSGRRCACWPAATCCAPSREVRLAAERGQLVRALLLTLRRCYPCVIAVHACPCAIAVPAPT